LRLLEDVEPPPPSACACEFLTSLESFSIFFCKKTTQNIKFFNGDLQTIPTCYNCTLSVDWSPTPLAPTCRPVGCAISSSRRRFCSSTADVIIDALLLLWLALLRRANDLRNDSSIRANTRLRWSPRCACRCWASRASRCHASASRRVAWARKARQKRSTSRTDTSSSLGVSSWKPNSNWPSVAFTWDDEPDRFWGNG